MVWRRDLVLGEQHRPSFACASAATLSGLDLEKPFHAATL
jgi:hypothetical protein